MVLPEFEHTSLVDEVVLAWSWLLGELSRGSFECDQITFCVVDGRGGRGRRELFPKLSIQIAVNQAADTHKSIENPQCDW